MRNVIAQIRVERELIRNVGTICSLLLRVYVIASVGRDGAWV